MAATLLILRATELLTQDRGHDAAVKVALLLYATYNLTATLSSVPAGRCDRLPLGSHGREGVSGLSPEEAYAKAKHTEGFCFRLLHSVQHAQGWNKFWNSQTY